MAKGIKTGGRQAGTPNRLTSELRTILKNIIANELEALPETLKEIEPKDRLDIIVRLIPFVLPKVEMVNMEVGEPFGWTLE